MYVRCSVYQFYLVFFTEFSKRPACEIVFVCRLKLCIVLKNFTAVWLSVDLQKLAARHLLNRSIESKM